MQAFYCVYIMTNKKYGTLYVGMTSNLIRRIYEHRNGLVDGFTIEHGLHILVYYEVFENPLDAITREKQMKKWNRDWKINKIEAVNPLWKDLNKSLL